MVTPIYIFGDGGNKTLEEIGSYATITLEGNLEEENLVGSSTHSAGLLGVTGSNQVETAACLAGLLSNYQHYQKRILTGERFHFHYSGDNIYVINGLNRDLETWKQNEFVNSYLEPMADREVWQLIAELIDLYPNVKVSAEWIEGHQHDGDTLSDIEKDGSIGSKYNYLCDQICTEVLGEIEEIPLEEREAYFFTYPGFLTDVTREVNKLKDKKG